MPPPNDNIANAQLISGDASSGLGVQGSNVGATVEPILDTGYWSNELAKVSVQGATPVQGVPTCCPNPPVSTVWYFWHAPSSSGGVHFFKAGSDFPSTIQVYNSNSNGDKGLEVQYVYNESLGIGGGAAFDSRVTFGVAGGAYYLIRIGGRSNVAIGIQNSVLNIQYAPHEGNFWLVWGPWVQPFLGSCGGCLDFQSEICVGTVVLGYDPSSAYQPNPPFKGLNLPLQKMVIGNQSAAGYYKLFPCRGGWGDVCTGTSSSDDGSTIGFGATYITQNGILCTGNPNPGQADPGSPGYQAGFYNIGSFDGQSNFPSGGTGGPCVVTNPFCSDGEFGFYAIYSNGDFPVFDLGSFPFGLCGNGATPSPVFPYEGWSDSWSPEVITGANPPLVNVVFNPLDASKFTPISAGFNNLTGGLNSDGMHWGFSFNARNNSGIYWPNIRLRLLNQNGISGSHGYTNISCTTAGQVSNAWSDQSPPVPFSSGSTPGDNSACVPVQVGADFFTASGGGCGPVHVFTADIWNQLCTASLQVEDVCGHVAGGGTIDFPLYPLVSLQLVSQNNSEVTYGGKKYWEFDVAITEYPSFYPPWNPQQRNFTISTNGEEFPGFGPLSILNAAQNQTGAPSLVVSSNVVISTLKFYIEANAGSQQCQLQISVQYGTWPALPLFTAQISINGA